MKIFSSDLDKAKMITFNVSRSISREISTQLIDDLRKTIQGINLYSDSITQTVCSAASLIFHQSSKTFQ